MRRGEEEGEGEEGDGMEMHFQRRFLGSFAKSLDSYVAGGNCVGLEESFGEP